MPPLLLVGLPPAEVLARVGAGGILSLVGLGGAVVPSRPVTAVLPFCWLAVLVPLLVLEARVVAALGAAVVLVVVVLAAVVLVVVILATVVEGLHVVVVVAARAGTVVATLTGTAEKATTFGTSTAVASSSSTSWTLGLAPRPAAATTPASRRRRPSSVAPRCRSAFPRATATWTRPDRSPGPYASSRGSSHISGSIIVVVECAHVNLPRIVQRVRRPPVR